MNARDIVVEVFFDPDCEAFVARPTNVPLLYHISGIGRTRAEAVRELESALGLVAGLIPT